MPRDAGSKYILDDSENSYDDEGDSFYTAHESSFSLNLADEMDGSSSPLNAPLTSPDLCDRQNILEVQLSDALQHNKDLNGRISHLEAALEAKSYTIRLLTIELEDLPRQIQEYKSLWLEAKKATEDLRASMKDPDNIEAYDQRVRTHCTLLRRKVVTQSSLIEQGLDAYRKEKATSDKLRSEVAQRVETPQAICERLKRLQKKMSIDLDTFHQDAARLVREREEVKVKSDNMVQQEPLPTLQKKVLVASTHRMLLPTQKDLVRTSSASTSLDTIIRQLSTAKIANEVKVLNGSMAIIEKENTPAKTYSTGINMTGIEPSKKHLSKPVVRHKVASSPKGFLRNRIRAQEVHHTRSPLGTPTRGAGKQKEIMTKDGVSSSPFLKPSERLNRKTFGTPLKQNVRY